MKYLKYVKYLKYMKYLKYLTTKIFTGAGVDRGDSPLCCCCRRCHRPAQALSAGQLTNTMMMMMMACQHIPTSHIPTRWEYVIMMKGRNTRRSVGHILTMYKSIIYIWVSFPRTRKMVISCPIFFKSRLLVRLNLIS